MAFVFFFPLVAHPWRVLYSDSSDLLALHIPAKRFLVRSWQADGVLPLWNPYSFGGAPFVHDVQGAVLYPPHLLLVLLPESWVGPALSWLIVLHVLLAGLGMFAYARDQGLTSGAAVVAGAGAMLAGRWLLHLLGGGHYVTIGLAWLPLVLLALDRTVRRGGLLWPSLTGAAFALVVLSTQPQWTLYAGLFAALWTFGTALECAGWWSPQAVPVPLGTALGRWALGGAWALVLAVGLAMASLLPALEAAGLSTRSGGVQGAGVLAGGLQTLLFLIGPALTTTPANAAWEDRGGLGLLWLLAAMLAPLVARGRVRYQASVTAALFLFALGGAVFFQGLPGFRLFRQPTRMLVLAGLPVAYLAGVTTQQLFAGPGPMPALLARCRRLFLLLVAACVVLVGGFALRLWAQGTAPAGHAYWLSLVLTVPAAFWALRCGPAALRPRQGLAWSALLLLDLWALAGPLVQTRPEDEIYTPSACVHYLMGPGAGSFRVLDRDEHGSQAGSPLGTGALLAPLCGLEPVRGYSPLDVKRYKEYLQMVADRDADLRPFDTSGLTYPVIGNFPVLNRPLLDLLGVRYLLQPATQPPEGPDWQTVLEDAAPQAYVLDYGMAKLPSYRVYLNPKAQPRAFVVHEAVPLPERPQVLTALKETDLRQKVFLEGITARKVVPAGRRAATIRSYRPNEVVIDVGPGPAGYLVLADVWFPGWTSTVAGEDHVVYRADFLFRAVEVPGGPCQAVFRFEPVSFRLGLFIALATLGLLVAVLLLAWLRAGRRARAAPAFPLGKSG